MTHSDEPVHVHIKLMAGRGSDGSPVFEVLPARSLGGDLFELGGSPGLTLGCAAGDVLRVADDGAFEVAERGENMCVQAYRGAPFTSELLAELTTAVQELGGLVEAPPTRQFIVVTVARAVGESVVEEAMDAWAAGIDQAEWWWAQPDEA